MSQHIKLSIPQSLAGERLDLALVKLLPDFSRRKIRAAIDAGGCHVNQKKIRMSSMKVSFGQKIELVLTHSKSSKKINLEEKHLVHLDKDFVVINKPPGMYSQAAKNHDKDHLLYCLKELFLSMKEDPTGLALVHRLDAETSGLIVVSRTNHFTEFMQQKFKDREVQKTYHALSYGKLSKPKITCENYLSKNHLATGLVSITDPTKGKHALTHFKELKYFSKYNLSLIEAKPKTGRTHQIRVHLSALKCPILGDKKYLTTKAPSISKALDVALHEHHMLHAHTLEWQDEQKKKYSFSCPYPSNFSKIVDYLK